LSFTWGAASTWFAYTREDYEEARLPADTTTGAQLCTHIASKNYDPETVTLCKAENTEVNCLAVANSVCYWTSTIKHMTDYSCKNKGSLTENTNWNLDTATDHTEFTCHKYCQSISFCKMFFLGKSGEAGKCLATDGTCDFEGSSDWDMYSKNAYVKPKIVTGVCTHHETFNTYSVANVAQRSTCSGRNSGTCTVSSECKVMNTADDGCSGQSANLVFAETSTHNTLLLCATACKE
jgi:hypothetical protein